MPLMAAYSYRKPKYNGQSKARLFGDIWRSVENHLTSAMQLMAKWLRSVVKYQ